MKPPTRHPQIGRRVCAGALVVMLAVPPMLVGCTTDSNRAVDDAARPMPAAAQPDTQVESRAKADAASPGQIAGTADGGSSGGASVSWPSTVDASADMVVARVGGRDIPLNELVTKWILRDPEGVRGLLDDLVLSRIMILEAGSLGLEPSLLKVDEAVRRQLKVLEAKARAAHAPDLEAYIRERLGFEPDVFMRNLNKESAIDYLAPRCVRSWLLANDRREVRAITVGDQAGVDEVQARLARGDAFADIAKDLSTDGSKDDGGRIPPLVRGASTLARTAFATEVGHVGGPVQEGGVYLFVLVEADPDILEGSWAEVGPAVEQSLVARKVEDPEFWQWKEAMTGRYDVDLSPFLDLVR